MSSRIIIVQGVTKYLHKVKVSKLDKMDVRYKPLHLSKEYNKKDPQVKKYLAKMTWFKNKPDVKEEDTLSDWKDDLPHGWRGSSTSQRPAPDKNLF